ncbi:3-hydroxyacyl-CoA dehydrogenase [Caldimonas brevitalea]|uniref:3-hydroxyacyl-CoA dehydrogenase n=1 Tax=Caldimonas brevitalea TaxID=413882 RepID=A0A0G3BT52_9BURK|nr:3-hydroxyacyl-CoA dehydrogenase [Caldimonas brevitalea]AKJ30551.1 3-hydroxyacyl-CoA dehydrogenase [Caldimonas brevitalea]
MQNTDLDLSLPAVDAAGLRLAVVGSGVMGRGIAQIAALAGLHVTLHDAKPNAAQEAVRELGTTLDRLVEKGKLGADAAQAAVARLQVASGLGDLAGCDVVVEAIVEDLGIKRALFADLEAVVGPHCVLATNTSSLSVTAIAAGLKRPQRVAGFHFFNPVPLMKIVEVIDGLLTAPPVSDFLLGLGRRCGHTAVRAKDTPGFIVNHAGRGYGTEALRLLAEGVAEFHQLDRILRDTAGFRLGPFELMDLTALDVSHPVMESIYHQYYEEPRFRPQPLTRQMLNAGVVGRKVGRGFYRYDGGQQQRFDEAPAPAERPSRVWISARRPEARERLAALVAQLGGTLDEAARPAPDSLCIVTPLGHDTTTCATAEGLDPRRTVAVDWLFDHSRRRVVMTTPVTSPETRAQARGLFGADGVPVSVVRDSAGGVAPRVLATIINIACEIAQQRIAAPADIDRAVTLGLGYPFGPLAWGDRLGPATVLSLLDELLASTGDPRYRASGWLKRRAQLGVSLLTDEE